jgi:Fic family protein
MTLSELLQRIDELKVELISLLPMDAVQRDRLWQKLRLEWNYNSNHIEGNTLTYGETFLLLVHGKTAGDHSVREIDEMRAHNVAITMVQQWAQEKERPIMEADIRDLNKLLLKEPFWKSARTADGQETSIQIIPGEY